MKRVFGDSFFFIALLNVRDFCISFEAMRAERLEEALTGDHHFTQAGFTLLMDPSQLE